MCTMDLTAGDDTDKGEEAAAATAVAAPTGTVGDSAFRLVDFDANSFTSSSASSLYDARFLSRTLEHSLSEKWRSPFDLPPPRGVELVDAGESSP